MKSKIRQSLKSQLNKITYKHETLWNKDIVKQVTQWINTHQPNTIGTFIPINKEPRIWEHLQTYSNQIKLYVPKFNNSLGYYQWTLHQKPLKASKFGIPEPITFNSPKKPLDTCFVPALGIDKNLNRIGWGHGYFDRLLSKEVRHRIGIIFSIQHINITFPVDSWDIGLTDIIKNN